MGGWEKEKRCLGEGPQRGTHTGSKSLTALRAKASELKRRGALLSRMRSLTRLHRRCVHYVFEHVCEPPPAIGLGYWSETRLELYGRAAQ